MASVAAVADRPKRLCLNDGTTLGAESLGQKRADIEEGESPDRLAWAHPRTVEDSDHITPRLTARLAINVELGFSDYPIPLTSAIGQ